MRNLDETRSALAALAISPQADLQTVGPHIYARAACGVNSRIWMRQR